MTLEEAAGLLAGWTAHQRDGALQELRQHPVAHGGIVEDQLQLGRTAGTKHDAVGVGDPDRRQIFIADEAAPRGVRLQRLWHIRRPDPVLPQAQERGLSQSPLRRARRIAHLRHQLRFGPRDLPRIGILGNGERRARAGKGLEPGTEIVGHLRRKPGADLADVSERAVPRFRQQQRG